MQPVLVIDDDVGLCELVAEYLEPEGYKVEAVHNGEAGVARALSNEHALTVLDVMSEFLAQVANVHVYAAIKG